MIVFAELDWGYKTLISLYFFEKSFCNILKKLLIFYVFFQYNVDTSVLGENTFAREVNYPDHRQFSELPYGRGL